ncbi:MULTISPECIES: type I glyceraldehyde-3-phosphate dehydrogenase [Halomonadaceae]|jgi:glyceraldehyde 3-phosphate dehydrogenase|uniref:Glyceraldehyde-3-phosphate dehydrogenase n=1 Tax=Vreelandella piezotolerans TaxID=2609667 RepID=A0ABQ6X5A1_9GAMM|nr:MULTISPECIES: type I glyceraldehyde-3-phosphate dehydrogenase [Halomonas]KFC50765.1 glyceraldehyde-3-phosphate dehydrogenase [Halomonas sp. SUBG004]KAE8437201.1 type I glyceraldehyde-3-phosphate dehydrogenase [Halomonas piezotolerans]MCG7577438.1 type I glyceraldehyde-3-phosphate dehydrogenase [Halomonas sp. MMH1-48]MCG7590967.1 type I glyceraldehyde-3-phosphate dehydrogenase [Halomonas sp. McD50-5]MCG7604479.1 type I glyceraldehyde-3-phosphate dehydrogenase [Halomonas sp. MM17-34]
MTIRVAINGFGRIGRNVLRALYENGYRDRVQVVAINDLGDPSLNSHLLRHDTVHGHFPFSVEHDAESISVDGDRITISSERDPANLPWASMDIDLVMECTGLFTKREAAAKHIAAGAKRVLISAPSPDADATIVYGVNDDILTAEHTVVSNASCTTNCLAPVAKALNDAVGIENGLMTTVHAYTNDQNLSDVYHSDPYRARSATHSMIPTKTGAAAAVGLVLPELAGKFDGLAVRVPVINVSLVDLTFTAGRDTTKEEINEIVEKAAANSPVLAVNAQPLVSIDFNHDAHSSTFDANHTRVNGRLVKIMAWYDNEWGFSNRMLDTAIAMQKTAQ